MPELPEVETIVRALRGGGRGGQPIVGCIVAQTRLLWPRTLAAPSEKEFHKRIRGQTVRAVERCGKYILIHFTQNTLLVHLRMTGDLQVESAGTPIAPHHRLLIEFKDGLRLAFNDPRKFGRVWLTLEPKDVVGHLGPEPWEPELTGQNFYHRLNSRRRQLKPLLMDQTFLAGLGNIYTDEALFKAGLHPLTISNDVSAQQADELLAAIQVTLEEGIRRNGASIDWAYRGGEFQNLFQVYKRAGEACYSCQSQVERIVVGQRGTHLCPTCQSLLPSSSRREQKGA